MKKLVFLVLLMTSCLAAYAAGPRQYYDYPDAVRIRDESRLLIYDNLSGSRNLTGAKLKEELSSQPVVFGTIATPATAPIQKQAGPADGPYVRQLEVKDATGKITMWVNASGAISFGTPTPLSVAGINPANGATNVATTAIPFILLNKSTPDVTGTNFYITGDSTTPWDSTSSAGVRWDIPIALQPNTTYTINFDRLEIVQTDGEITSSCGTAMADVAGSCQSTFTTAP